MGYPDHGHSSSHLIRLDKAFLQSHGRNETGQKLRRIVRSVKFELDERMEGFRILGPDAAYHEADPHLSQVLGNFREGLSPREIASYRSRRKLYDLCFEDSWSGYFIADQMTGNGKQHDLVLIHLDDHTDMMPTLLVSSDAGLTDPVSGKPFDPAEKSDWEAAIFSGAVGIGSFITPLYYSEHKVHVRHVNNYSTSTYGLYNVTRGSRRYSLIPDKQFAAIRKITSDWDNSAGTYLGGRRADKVLENIPKGCVIVHIDLDYFINDFNGNVGEECSLSSRDLRNRASQKLEYFFDSLGMATSSVDRWIIATSPGFCSAFHWSWLLSRIEQGIEKYEAMKGNPRAISR